MAKMPKDIARIQPMGDLVLIRRIPRGDVRTKGGVMMPGQCDQQFFKADVLAVGPGQQDVGVHNPPDVNENDIVIVQEEQSELTLRPGQMLVHHLIPVSVDYPEYFLVPSGRLYAIQLPESEVDPERVAPEPEPDADAGEPQHEEDTTDVNTA